MPAHFFWQTLHVDYASAIRADLSKQHFTVAPRHWYVDAVFRCDRCGEEFCFTAAEQKAWYEDYGFYVSSLPKKCPGCRRQLRRLKALQQEYDRKIAEALTSKELDLKIEVVNLIDQLQEAGATLSSKVHAKRALLAKQIARQSKRGNA